MRKGHCVVIITHTGQLSLFFAIVEMGVGWEEGGFRNSATLSTTSPQQHHPSKPCTPNLDPCLGPSTNHHHSTAPTSTQCFCGGTGGGWRARLETELSLISSHCCVVSVWGVTRPPPTVTGVPPGQPNTNNIFDWWGVSGMRRRKG